MYIGFKYGIMLKIDLGTTLTNILILAILCAATSVRHAYIITNSADIPKIRE